MKHRIVLLAAGAVMAVFAAVLAGTAIPVAASATSENGLITWSGVWARGLDQKEEDITFIAAGSNPAWSADGTLLAYDRQEPSGIGGVPTIFVSDRFGCNEEMVAVGRHPSWSPDGSKLAFDNEVGGNTDIYIVNRDGSGLVRLTDEAESDTSPAWSPDGSKIAFTSHRAGDDEVYVMDADGSDEARLTYSTYWSGYPDWSPDGTKIVYSSMTYWPSLFETNVDIMVISSSGGPPIRLSSDPIDDPHPVQDWRPAWSPDGTMIVFQSDLYDVLPCPGWPGLPWQCRTSRIWVMDADGTNLRLVSHEEGISGRTPDWQPEPSATGPMVRVAGLDRYSTAVEVSKQAYPSGSVAAFVAVADNFPDALVGGPLAALWDGPILLSQSDVLPGATAAELTRLGPDTIVVLGGAGVISDTVFNQLAGYADSVVRVAGLDRYSTAVEVSKQAYPSGSVAAFVAVADNFPDALVGGPLAALWDGPILLSQSDVLPGATAAELTRLGPDTIVVLGGAGVISDTVFNQLAGYADSVVRVAGLDRYSTAVEVSKQAYPSGSVAAFVAVADNFPDALVGGPLAALWDGPILLSQSDVLPGATAAELTRLGPDTIVVLGGAGVISDTVFNQLACTVLP